MSAEDDRTKESATVLNKVATAAFPATGLAPWMSQYNKQTEAVIVGVKTVGDISKEIDRRQWMSNHPKQKPPESDADPDEPAFDASKARGGSGMVAFCLNRLASNMHNYAPSVDGMRTRQAIALAKANNPGVATQPGAPEKRSLWQKLTMQGKDKEKVG